MTRRSCWLVGGILLTARNKIYLLLLALAVAVSVNQAALGGTPDDPLENPVAVAMVPDPQPNPAPVPQVPSGADIPAVAAPVLAPNPLKVLRVAALRQVKAKVVGYRDNTWRWQSMMGVPRTPFGKSAVSTNSLPYAKWVLRRWQNRAKRQHAAARAWMTRRITAYRSDIDRWRLAMGIKRSSRQLSGSGSLEYRFNLVRHLAAKVYRQFRNPPQKGNFLCIHGHEGSWSDRGAPYYGGVQFGYPEWQTYGQPYTRKQYAYQATPLEQLWAAYRYWRVSGFHPWPQTARMCGLL